MAFPIPKFAYPSSITGTADFVPTYPPNKKTPLAPIEATRHDSLSSSGIKQSVIERIDTFVQLQFDTVPEGDLPSWQLFFLYALTGGQFTYYPDSTNPAVYGEYTLEDQTWSPTWKALQTYAFAMKLRAVVGPVAVYYS